ncbi:MAG TPA: hypothetical protein VMV81_12175 [Phycisphaerae bacterium]|nr:hypothetical protein [Phycisphaerae bacterium]
MRRARSLVMLVFTAALFTAGLAMTVGSACDNHQKLADKHDEILKQEQAEEKK